MTTAPTSCHAVQVGPEPLPASRITIEDIKANIADAQYFTLQQRLTICVLTLKNGFMAVGKSACVSATNFDAETGRRLAYANAMEEIWAVMGYALLDKLAQAGA